ncbi:MAG: helix-turn-helix transcriptional regulator [Gammaproteobacteria bacterium]|nr:helix-turn-helix transcriptional regulator [Gammaproteobacteria bacterium]
MTGSTLPESWCYRVSLANGAEGTLLKVSDTGGRKAPAPGRMCWQYFERRTTPCTGCPLFNSGAGASVGIIKRRSGATCLVMVNRRGRTADVLSWGVRDSTLSEFKMVWAEHLTRDIALSGRQHQVMQLLLRGSGQSEIAKVLRITPRTVKYHTGIIARKLGAKSGKDLFRFLLAKWFSGSVMQTPGATRRVAR